MAKDRKQKSPIALYAGLIRGLLRLLPGGDDRQRLRLVVAAALGATSGVFFTAGHLVGALGGVAAGAAAGVALVSRFGAKGWAGLWLAGGALYGNALGSLEGTLYGLVWGVPAMVWQGSLGLCAWGWIERAHPATAQRLVQAFCGMLVTPVVFAVPLGLMGLADLGFSDDVLGVMAMGGILGVAFGLSIGWFSLEIIQHECPACGRENRVATAAELSRLACRSCRASLADGSGSVGRGSLGRAWLATVAGALKGAVLSGLICLALGGAVGAGVGGMTASLGDFPRAAGLMDGFWRGLHAGALSGVVAGAFAGAWRAMVPAMGGGAGGRLGMVWAWGPLLTLLLVGGLAWEVRSNAERQVFSLKGPGYGLQAMAAAGRRLAVADADENLVLWDTRTGEYKSWETEVGGLQALALGGGWLAAGGDGNTWRKEGPALEIRSLDDLGNPVRLSVPGGVWALAFSGDGRSLAAGAGDSSVVFFETASWSAVARLPLEKAAAAIALGAGGRLAVVQEGDIVLFGQGADGAYRREGVLQGHGWQVRDLGFASGSLLFSGGMDRSVRLWDVESRTAVRVWAGGDVWDGTGHRDYVWTVAARGDTLLASGDTGGTVRLWDAAGGARAVLRGYDEYPLWALLGGHTRGVRALAFVDGWLVSGGEGGVLRFWRY